MLEIILILILAYLLRILPHYTFKPIIGSDTWFHISYSEEIKKNNYQIPKHLNKFLLNDVVAYPYLYHYLISWIPLKNKLYLEKHVSAFIDTIFILSSYLMAIYITKSENIAFIVSLSLSISPTLLSVSSGPRAYQGTPRTFGELLVFFSFISLYLFFQTENYLWIISSAVFGGFSFLTSKFSVQVFVLFLPVMAFFLDSVIPIIMIFLVFITAIIFSKDKYMKIIRGQYNHLYTYATVMKEEWGLIRELNSTYNYKKFFRLLLKGRAVEALKILYTKLLYFNIIFKAPELYLFIFMSLIYNFEVLNNIYLIAWAISGGIIFFITSTYSFKFIGEAERYIEYSLFPITLYLAIYLEHSIFLPIILGFFIILYVWNLFLWFNSSRGFQNFEKNLFLATDFIKNNYPNDKNLLPFVARTPFYQGVILTGVNILATFQLDRKEIGEEQWDKLYEIDFPVYTNDIAWLEKEYKINLILVYRPYIKSLEKQYNINYNFYNYKNVYEYNDFIVYEKKL